jgi:hypothetical protein
MIVYSINDYIETDATLLGILGMDSLTIQPFIGSEDSKAPFITYRYNQDIQNINLYYIHHDTIKYSIVDLDIDRGFKTRNRIIDLLNKADNIQIVNIADTYGRLLYSNLLTSSDSPPTQPDGYCIFSLYFEVCWINNS